MSLSSAYRTTQEWESVVGDQIRSARIANDMDQTALASAANVSIGALSNLERGKGSSLSTVIAVVRALNRTDWLEGLAPSVSVSPLRMLENSGTAPRRVRARRNSSRPDVEHR
jgi:transcriptional regulator with XRE-family HTH domain